MRLRFLALLVALTALPALPVQPTTEPLFTTPQVALSGQLVTARVTVPTRSRRITLRANLSDSAQLDPALRLSIQCDRSEDGGQTWHPWAGFTWVGRAGRDTDPRWPDGTKPSITVPSAPAGSELRCTLTPTGTVTTGLDLDVERDAALQIGEAEAAVVHDADSTTTFTATTSFNWNHTTTSGSDRLIRVAVGFFDGGCACTVSAVTYNSVSLLPSGPEVSNTDPAVMLWHLTAPTTGTNSVAVTMSASAEGAAGAATYTGVDQTVPVAGFVSATGNSTAPSVAVSADVNEFAVDGASTSTAGSRTIGGGQTSEWNLNEAAGQALTGSREAGANAAAPIPTYRASGTLATGTGNVTVTYPSTAAAGDVCLLVAESENQAIALTTPAGFVEIPDSPQSAGTAATNPANRIAVYWKRRVGGDASPVITDPGDHATGAIHCFYNVIASGNPWDVTAGGNDGGSNDTSAVVPGDTTTVANTLVVLIQGTSNNATATTNCGAVTNADLGSITERFDSTNTIGLGGGHCIITGTKASASAYANSTLTLSVTTFKGAISIALKGEPGTSTTMSWTYPSGTWVTAATVIKDAAAAPGGCTSFITLMGVGCK